MRHYHHQMIEVRLAVPEDGDALGQIHSASWAVAYAPFFDPEFAARAIKDRLTRWHARITDETGTLLVASVDDQPLALSYSIPSPTRPGFAEIYSFYGHPDGWGTGVAGELMTHTLRTCTNVDMPKSICGSCGTRRSPAGSI